MKITKIKFFQKDTKVKIVYEKKNSRGGYDEFQIVTTEAPEPEFQESLQGLRCCLVDIAEMPKESLEMVSVVGLSVSHCYTSKKNIGVTILGLKALKNSSQSLSIVTPHKFSDFFGDSGSHKDLMPDGMLPLVHIVLDFALRFINGERAQTTLFNKLKNDIPEETPIESIGYSKRVKK